MLDGTIKTIMVDDSKTVGELLVTICSRIGGSFFYPVKFGRNIGLTTYQLIELMFLKNAVHSKSNSVGHQPILEFFFISYLFHLNLA